MFEATHPTLLVGAIVTPKPYCYVPGWPGMSPWSQTLTPGVAYVLTEENINHFVSYCYALAIVVEAPGRGLRVS